MNIQRLDYFITIAETGNLTKASERLFVSQPSLSQYLKRLENSLGVELFDRSVSPLRLTYAGERYYEYAKAARLSEENIQKELRDIKGQISGKLRLGVALWRGSSLLPDIFPLFHEKHPGIRLELFEGRSVYLQNSLMNDEIDLAVMNLPRTIEDDKLFYDVFMEERLMLAAPTDHPYIRNALDNQPGDREYPEISVDVLRHIPLINTKKGQRLTYMVNEILQRNDIKPEILLETGNLTTAINLVAQGMACTIVPEEGARVCERPGKVMYFTFSDSVTDCIWDLAVVYRKDAYLSHIARFFIDELHQLKNV